MDLGVMNFFSTAEIEDYHKQVESCEPGNTSEQSEMFLKTLAVQHQGRFIYLFNSIFIQGHPI